MAEVIVEKALPKVEFLENSGEFETAATELVARCDAAKIEYEKTEGIVYDYEYDVRIPQGRGSRELNIWSAQGAKELLSIEFENYRFIAGYVAVYSKSDDLIEASLEPVAGITLRTVEQRLFGQRSKSRDDDSVRYIKFSEGDKVVEVGTPSSVLSVLGQNSPPTTSIRIKGFRPSGHDEASRILASVSDKLFFEIDLVTRVGLTLVRDRQNRTRLGSATKAAAAVTDMPFPRNEYDHGPMSLYQYGRGAAGMPLLQFLAYYQVVESYYPVYSNNDLKRRIQNILKDPLFRADRESGVGRILSLLRGRGAGAIGSERSQLKSAIRECVDVDELRKFLSNPPSRKDFFTSRPSRAAHVKLSLSDEKADLINEVGDRLYNIRCEIVHTKDEGDLDEAQGRLLPFTQEAEQLHNDVELMQYIAQRVLIASSSPEV